MEDLFQYHNPAYRARALYHDGGYLGGQLPGSPNYPFLPDYKITKGIRSGRSEANDREEHAGMRLFPIYSSRDWAKQPRLRRYLADAVGVSALWSANTSGQCADSNLGISK